MMQKKYINCCNGWGIIKGAIFLDRDGVVNEVVYHPTINKPSSPWNIKEFKIIEGIKEPLEELSKNGYSIFIITNQPDVSRGFIEEGTTEKINSILKDHLPIHEIVTCPHDDHHHCTCRKPKPGMILDLAEKNDIDLHKSFVIGDGQKDIEAGSAAGCTTILIEKPYNKDVIADYKAADLQRASKIILD